MKPSLGSGGGAETASSLDEEAQIMVPKGRGGAFQGCKKGPPTNLSIFCRLCSRNWPGVRWCIQEKKGRAAPRIDVPVPFARKVPGTQKGQELQKAKEES